MADVMVIEFSAPNAAEIYNKVGGILGVDGSNGTGNWPAGLQWHTAAVDGNNLIVTEVWSSKAEQEKFLAERLGPAFGQAGVPEPSRVQWFSQIGGYHTH